MEVGIGRGLCYSRGSGVDPVALPHTTHGTAHEACAMTTHHISYGGALTNSPKRALSVLSQHFRTLT